MNSPSDPPASEPSPIPPPILTPIAEQAVTRSVAVRFCNRCGAAWQPDWIACAACTKPRATETEFEHASARSLISPLALYFVLLATILPSVFVDDEVIIEFTISAVDSIIVLIWCAICWREILPLLRQRPTAVALCGAALLGGATFSLAHVSVGLVSEWLNLPELRYSTPLLDAGYGWGIIILLICVQPALIEELAFRGIILGAVRRIMSDRDAVVVSAMMFMILHLAVLSLPHLLLMGIVAGFLRLRTRSIWPCVAMHFTHNSLCLLFEHLGLQ